MVTFMKNKILLSVIGVLLLGILSAAPARASKEAAGKAMAVRGGVTAVSSGQSRLLKINSPVYVQDTIVTGNRGRIQLVFRDNTIITLGRDSELTIAAYRWDDTGEDNAMTSEIKEGVFRILGGAITRKSPETFTTRTPVATIGIRGSIYKGRFRDNTLSVLFEGGTGIDVINAAGSVPILRPGYGTIVTDFNTAPEKASRFTTRQIEAIDRELAAGSPEDEQEKTEGLTETESSEQEQTGTTGRTEETAVDQMETGPLDTPGNLDQDRLEPEPQSAFVVTGRYKSLLQNENGTQSRYSTGDTAGTSDQGRVTGHITLSDSTTRSFAYQLPEIDPEYPYDGPHISEQTREFLLAGETRTLRSTIMSSPTGEFSMFSIPGEFLDNAAGPLRFHDFGYAGIPAQSVPSNGIDTYTGMMMAVGTMPSDNGRVTLDIGHFFCEINWHSGTYIAHLTRGPQGETGHGPLIFGDIDNTVFSSLHMAGPSPGAPDENNPGTVDFSRGVLETGEFYGNDGLGFGLTGHASSIDIETQSHVLNTRDFIAGALLEVDDFEIPAPSGTARFNGFVAGLSENMADPGLNRRLFMNTSSDDMSLSIDRDNGRVTGHITAIDQLHDTGDIHVTIGDNDLSAYVLDDHFIACLSDGPEGSADITRLKPYGNYLVTAAPRDEDDMNSGHPTPGHQFSEHIQWGYWEAAYEDPVTEIDHHIHVPGSLWIAGELTPAHVVNHLAANGFIGTYEGGAEGIVIKGGIVSQLSGGHTELAIDFSPGAQTPVSGSISFDAATLNVTGHLPVNGAGFTAGINGADHGVNGAFFGPGAEAMGGNFKGFDNDILYTGIFGGNLR